jgi:uncharacterized protein (TIRG00374 family)
LRTALKVAVSVLLIGLLIRGIDADGLLARLTNVEPWAMAAAIFLTLAVSPVHAARWMIVIRALGAHMPFAQALPIVLIGYFFNQVLPSSMGGDAMRVWRAFRAGLGVSDALNSVVLDRVAALSALVLITLSGLPWLASIIDDPVARSALALVMLAGCAGLALLMLLDRMPDALLRWRATRALARLSASARKVFLTGRHAIPVVSLSVLAQMVGGVMMYVLARGIQVQVGLMDCLLLFPPVLLATMVPISIAGWGVREGAMVVIFGFAGVASADAFALSVLSGIAVLFASLPCGLIWLLSGHHRESSNPPTDKSPLS